jgi:hypothetical protein
MRVPGVDPDFSVEGNLGKRYGFVVFHRGTIALAESGVNSRKGRSGLKKVGW